MENYFSGPCAWGLAAWMWEGSCYHCLCFVKSSVSLLLLCCRGSDKACSTPVCASLVCAVSGEPVASQLSVWVMLVMPTVPSFLYCYPGLLYLSLTSGYCFHLFCSFANKVALTKADLQGREGSCSHYHFGLKDALCNPWYLFFRGLQAVTLLGQQQLWEGAELCVLQKQWQKTQINAWKITKARPLRDENMILF